MKKAYFLIAPALLFSLFVYLFYRTEQTVITDLFISLVSRRRFVEWKAILTSALPLNKYVVYALPEGLWVFSITLTSRRLFVKARGHEWPLLLLPLICSVGLELCQLIHLSNGHFDWWDVGLSVLCWAAANYLVDIKSPKQNLFRPFTARSLICILTYLIVYMAHVWK